MRELEVVLAIALTFLVASSFISMFVEIGFRFLAIRFKDLQNMLSEFYDKELSVLVSNEVATNKTVFVNHVTKLNANNYSVDVREFIERLASSEVAHKIKQDVKAETDLLVNEFARRYDNYGKAASFAFKRKAARLNMLLSIILALVMNINVVTLAYTFLENRSLTEQLISQTPLILEQAEKQQKDLDDAINKATNQAISDDSIADFADSVNKLNSAVAHIDTLALPIGWSSFDGIGLKEVLPGLTCGSSTDQKQLCLDADAWVYKTFNIVFWFVVTFATGLLIGLGGPFWFDMVRRITAARSILIKQPASAPVVSSAETSDDSDDLQNMRKNLADLFEQTYQANLLLGKLVK